METNYFLRTRVSAIAEINLKFHQYHMKLLSRSFYLMICMPYGYSSVLCCFSHMTYEHYHVQVNVDNMRAGIIIL